MVKCFLLQLKVVNLVGGEIMPNIKSSKKRALTSEKARVQNFSQKNEMRTAVKKAQTAKAENAENRVDLTSAAVKHIDKAVKKSLIHGNKASRMKSQLMSK